MTLIDWVIAFVLIGISQVIFSPIRFLCDMKLLEIYTARLQKELDDVMAEQYAEEDYDRGINS